MKFSVVISVYKNDKPEYVSISFDSIINQTCPPSEIVLIVDGPVPSELDMIIDNYKERYSPLFNVIRLSENQGLGNALRIAIEATSFEIVARMDSDDIADPTRFEKQIKAFHKDNKLSIIGSQISEFIDSQDNIVAYRYCPCDDAQIKEYMKKRCPFNHMTVMFRKSEVIKSGNYQDWFWNEDYYLWIRMMLAGCKFANLPDVLVNVRTGRDMYARRGGMKYFKSEAALQKYMLKNHVIGYCTYMMNIIKRFIVQVALPNSVRGWVFRNFARKR